MTLVRNEWLTTKLFGPLYTFAFSTWKKLKGKFTETQGNSSKVQTQLLSNLNAAKSWVTGLLPSNLLPEYRRKTYIKGFLSFLAGWHLSHSSSNLQEFALNRILWVSAAGEDQSARQWVLGHAQAQIWEGRGLPNINRQEFLIYFSQTSSKPCQTLPTHASGMNKRLNQENVSIASRKCATTWWLAPVTFSARTRVSPN